MLPPDKRSDEHAIIDLIQADLGMMRILKFACELNLSDWCIGAGFVRNKVWDSLHEKFGTPTFEDIDLVYFDESDCSEERDHQLEETLRLKCPSEKWSVKNQARMHTRNGDQPYRSTEDALTHWPEICTAIGIRLERNNSLTLVAPLGVKDIWQMIIRPTPHFRENRFADFKLRQAKKNWPAQWPKVRTSE